MNVAKPVIVIYPSESELFVEYEGWKFVSNIFYD